MSKIERARFTNPTTLLSATIVMATLWSAPLGCSSSSSPEQPQGSDADAASDGGATPTETETEAGADGAACVMHGKLSSNATCQTCMANDCCDLANAVLDDPLFADFVACYADCAHPGSGTDAAPDAGQSAADCEDKCLSEFPDLAAKFKGELDCEKHLCATDCPHG